MNRTAGRIIQYTLLVVGTLLLGAAAVAQIDHSVSSRLALDAFDRAQKGGAASGGAGSTPGNTGELVDFSLWSANRIREYRASLSIEKHPALAVLQIDRLQIRVPVFEGTDDLVLNRGVGWIDGTGKPGGDGNMGIAGHRDGFFRGLKDIAVGDAITLQIPGRQFSYSVDQIEIVSPDRVDVLDPRGAASITLVTCYPFYFVGDAPQRFIVHAKQTSATGR